MCRCFVRNVCIQAKYILSIFILLWWNPKYTCMYMRNSFCEEKIKATLVATNVQHKTLTRSNTIFTHSLTFHFLCFFSKIYLKKINSSLLILIIILILVWFSWKSRKKQRWVVQIRKWTVGSCQLWVLVFQDLGLLWEDLLMGMFIHVLCMQTFMFMVWYHFLCWFFGCLYVFVCVFFFVDVCVLCVCMCVCFVCVCDMGHVWD